MKRRKRRKLKTVAPRDAGRVCTITFSDGRCAKVALTSLTIENEVQDVTDSGPWRELRATGRRTIKLEGDIV